MLPTGTVCLVFTDIEGSTAIWDRAPEVMATALARHDSILSERIRAEGGQVVKHTGDGVFAVFDEVPGAVSAVLAFQEDLAREEWPDPVRELKVRVGIHVGSVTETGGDYFGPDLSRTSRLEAAAHGGQVLFSEAARALAIDHLAEGVGFFELGEFRFKGLIRPERVFQLVAPGLASEFPPLRVERVGAGAGLPSPTTSLFGRDVLIDRIEELVEEGRRLITLTGPGGVGKSRLSLEVAARLASRFPHGAHFVGLSAIDSRDEAVQAVIEALEFNVDTHSSDDLPLDQLAGYLSRRQVLLVLDNYEQLVEGAAELPGEILSRSTGSLALVTSRQRLQVSAEWHVEVPGLETGGPKPPAVELFAERAARAGASIEAQELGSVAAICELVDGLPLGIELAASWAGMLTLQEIIGELGGSLTSLEVGARDVPDRHRTLAAACETSWNLLTPEERRVFAALGIFKGRFGKSSAEAVAGCDLKTLAALSSKSMVRGWGLFELHPLLRRFARERLEETGAHETAARHGRHYVDLVRRLVPDLDGGRQIDAREEIRQELQDVLAAFRWVVRNAPDGEVLAALPALAAFMRLQGWHEAKAEFGRLRQIGVERFAKADPAMAALDAYWAAFAVELDDPAVATQVAMDRLPALDGLPFERAIALNTVGIGLCMAGRYEESAEMLEAAVDACRQVGADVGLGAGLLWLGWDWLELGQADRAEPLFEESLDLFRSRGNAWGSAYALSKLGLVADTLGDHRRAMDYHHEGREVFVKLGDRAGEAYTLSRLSWTHWLLGNHDAAEECAAEALSLFEEIGHLWGGIAGHGRRGFARIGRSKLAEAADDFGVVLERALPAGIATMVAYGVIGFGSVLVASGDDDVWAVEILSCVAADDGVPRQYRHDYVDPALDALRARTPADQFEAARERGSVVKLSDMAERLVSQHAQGHLR